VSGPERRKPKPRRPKGMGSLEKLPSGSWRGTITVAGERRQATFPKHHDARDWLDTQALEAAARRSGVAETKGTRGNVTLADLAEDFLADLKVVGRTEDTLRGYRGELKALVARYGTVRARDVDGPMLERMVREQAADGWRPSTVRNRVIRVTAMVRYAQRQGWIPARPLPVRLPRVTIASRPDAYAREEVDALLEAARQRPDRRYLVAVLLGADAGLRLSEAIRARVDDADLERRVLTIPVRDEQDRPKSGKERKVPLTARLAEAIRQLSRSSGEFLIGRPGWKSRRSYAEWLEELWAEAGVEGTVRFHRLRHYWATELANAGASPYELMAWAGWASLTTALRYVHDHPMLARRGPFDALEQRVGLSRTDPPRRTGRDRT
jgi:integrase